MDKKNPVVHFEMPYINRDRVAKFYTDAFGWELQQLGPEMGNYITAATAETDEHQMIKTPGAINGGFYPKTAEAPSPSVVVAVEDIQAAMEKVRVAGGTVQGEPMEIKGIGQYVAFRDTEGNRASLLQTKP